MNYWHMQLHPNDRNSFSAKKIIDILKNAKVIGLGEAWNDSNGTPVDFPRQFKEDMQIGDVVLIRDTMHPIALVKITSMAWYAKEDEIDESFDWFPLRRGIEILGFFSKNEEELLNNALEQKKKNHIPSSGTLGSCSKNTATGIFIKNWLDKIQAEKKMSDIVNLLKHTHNLILHGAPGTGKTHLAREIAEAMGAEVGFVQFHPSYDYTDFVEGLRPVNDAGSGQIGFGRKDGVFKKFCERALENMNGFSEDNFAEAYQKLLDKVEEAEESETPYILKTLSHKKEFALKTNSLQNFYAVPQTDKKIHMTITKDSIRTYLRTGKISDWKPYLTAIAQHLIDDFGYKKQIQANEKKNFVFIIDEINRGEMSKIFGELFFAIDPSYRGAKICKNLRTQYANLQNEQNAFDEVLKISDSDNFGHFFIPENVYIIGTMNDIDRNVESMDFAFRRRFTFKEIKAKDTQEQILSELDDSIQDEAIRRMDSLNKAIDSIEGLSSAYHIGGAYFLKLKELGNDFGLLWEYHLEGLLREYLRGMEDADSKLSELRKAYENKAVTNQDESSNGQEQ